MSNKTKKALRKIEIQKKRNLAEIRSAILQLHKMRDEIGNGEEWDIQIVEVDDEEESGEEFVDYDNHDIRQDWNDIKEMMEEIEPDIEKVLTKKGVRASVRARNGLSSIRHLCIRLREGILFQRQDNRSGY